MAPLSIGAVPRHGDIYPGVPMVVGIITSPWPIDVMIRHYAARPNCAAARAVRLAPALRGQPGYWDHLDADDDGKSCEPYGGRRKYRY